MSLSSVFSPDTSDAVFIYLHREGMFWKADERSAYLFLSKKISHHFTKNAKLFFLKEPFVARTTMFFCINNIVQKQKSCG